MLRPGCPSGCVFGRDFRGTSAGVAARMLLHLQDLETSRQKAIAGNDLAFATSIESEEQNYLELVQALVEVTAQLASK